VRTRIHFIFTNRTSYDRKSILALRVRSISFAALTPAEVAQFAAVHSRAASRRGSAALTPAEVSICDPNDAGFKTTCRAITGNK
jgi:hypothetical protein